MQHADGRPPALNLVWNARRKFDWDAELSNAATLDRHERRVRELIADVGKEIADQREAGERIRTLTHLVHGLSRATLTDSLTRLRNRQGFVRDGCLLLSQATVRHRYATVFFFDVDRLKEVNDAAGHAAGDEMLRCAARALAATFRNGDVIGRLGGDEFAAITLTRCRDAAQVILDRLARAVNCINASHERWPLELSAGVAIADPGLSPSLGQLLDRADRLMYQDKQTRSAAQYGRVEAQALDARRCAASSRGAVAGSVKG